MTKEAQQDHVGEEEAMEGAEGKSIVDLMGSSATGGGEQSVMRSGASVNTVGKGIKVGNVYSLNTTTTTKVGSQQYPFSTEFAPTAEYLPLSKRDRQSRTTVSIAKGTPVQILKIWRSKYALVKLLGIRAAEFEFVVSINKLDPSPPEFILNISSQFFGNFLHSLLKDNKVQKADPDSLSLLKQVMTLILVSAKREIPDVGRDWMERDIVKYLRRTQGANYKHSYSGKLKEFYDHSLRYGTQVARIHRTNSRNGLVQINYLTNNTVRTSQGVDVNNWYIKKAAFHYKDLFDVVEEKKPEIVKKTRGYESGAEIFLDVFHLAANTYLFILNGAALMAEVAGTAPSAGTTAGLIPATAAAMLITGDAAITQIGVIYRKTTGTYEDGSKSNQPVIKQLAGAASKYITGNEQSGELIYEVGTFKLGLVRIHQSVTATKTMMMAGKHTKSIKPASGATTTAIVKRQQLVKRSGKC
ncbi:MAG: hypothetical protein AAFQ98_13265 [Bacteroidota bacterium]